MQQAKSWQWVTGLGFTFLYGSIEFILYFPLVVLIQLYVAGTPLWLTYVQFVLSYAVGYIGGRSTWLSRKIYEFLFAAFVGYGLAYLFQGSGWHLWVYAIIGLPLAYRGIQYTKDAWLNLFGIGGFLPACALYFIGVPIMGRLSDFQPYIGWMNGAGFATLVIFLFSVNRKQLQLATLASTAQVQAALSAPVRQFGRIWVLALLAIIAAAAYFQQLKQGATALVLAFFRWLFRMMQSGEPTQPPEPIPSAQPPQFPPPVPKGDPTWLDILLQYIQVIFGYLFVAAFIIFVGYLILSKAAPALLALIQRLLGRSNQGKQVAETESFTDEKEQLIDWHAISRVWWKQLTQKWSADKDRELKWSHLRNNQERIRFLYMHLVAQAAVKGYRFNKSLTPNETGHELESKMQMPAQAVHAITESYNQVRYGDISIDDTQLEQVLSAAKPILPKPLK